MKILITLLFIACGIYANQLDDRSKTCEELIKDKLSTREYDENDELDEIEFACLGNKKAKCLEAAFSELPKYQINDKEELLALASSCAYSRMACINYTKNIIPWYEQNDLEEIIEINIFCQSKSLRCLKRSCDDDPKFLCNSLKKIIEQTQNCF